MKFIRDFLSNRANVIEIFIVAILITSSINLITTSCYELIDFTGKDKTFFTVGILILLLSVVYFVLKILWKTSIKKDFIGFFIIGEKDKMPIDCTGYNYLEELKSNFEAGFAENKALEYLWLNDSIKRNDRDTLIVEATEYYLIDELSTHLTYYFNTRKLNKKQLVQLSRNDIPGILLTNRFLELFSKPMEQRAAFIKAANNLDEVEDESIGRVVYSMGENGAVFKDFDFVLPKGSKVSKLENNLVIDTKRFTIMFKVDYGGYSTVLPREFERYYLNLDNYDDFSTYEIGIEVLVKFKIISLFSRNGWDYYEWIELFLEKVEKNFSKENFFESINWRHIYTQTKVNENLATNRKRK